MNTVNVRKFIQQNLDYSLWHPFSNVNISHFNQIHFETGNGIYLYNDYGEEYVDLASGLWNMSLGYNNTEIQNAMIQQINKLSYSSLFAHTNNVAIACANALLDLTEGYMKKVIFACSGSETNEIAIKLMRKISKINGMENKKCILSFSESYHGTYYGSGSVSGLEQELVADYSPMLPKVDFVDAAYRGCNCSCEVDGHFECLVKFEKIVKERADEIAGIIIEPILASKGIQIPCKKYLKKLISTCKENKILVAFDEVATGFYRTGTCFYYNKLGVEPDILCLSKGINSGYLPVGAVLVNDTIERTFRESNEIFEHGSTQAGNLVACASVLAAIKEYQRIASTEDLIHKSQAFYKVLRDKLERFNFVRDVRHEGFLYSVDICGKDNDHDINQIFYVVNELLKNKIIVYPSEVGITLLPMLIMNSEQWKSIIDRIEKIFYKLDF